MISSFNHHFSQMIMAFNLHLYGISSGFPTFFTHRFRSWTFLGPPRYHNAGEYAVLQIWGEVHEVLKAYGVSGEAQAQLLESWKTKKGAPHQRGKPQKDLWKLKESRML